MIKFDHYAQFVTITCQNWLPFLAAKHHKQIVLEALKTRVAKQQLTVYGFVIMPNHMHLIWQLHDGIVRQDFQRDLLKFTARGILHLMKANDDPLYQAARVKAADRKYQVWERNCLRIDLYSENVFLQKLQYIHNNPVHPKWQLANLPENYLYSSARFYETGIDDFGWLSHFRG